MRTSTTIACICLLLCVCALTCEGGFVWKKPSGCYYSRRQCEAKCCCSGKKCKPTTYRGRTYHKCVTVDCGQLLDPANGKVTTHGGTTFESLAMYSCNDGYILSYPASRTCLSTSQWSGVAPRCELEPICEKQECSILEHPCHGFIVDPPLNPIPGDVVTYGCLEGFEVDGASTRTCLEDYTWEGISPCCVKKSQQMTEYGDEFGGSEYRIVRDDAKIWTEARSICEADGAYLVEINSESEKQHLEVILEIEEQTWWTNGNDIGNEGIWIWPIKGDDFSGENATVYTNWYPGEPRGPGCMTVHALEFDWFVEDCNDEFDFVCERTLNESFVNARSSNEVLGDTIVFSACICSRCGKLNGLKRVHLNDYR